MCDHKKEDKDKDKKCTCGGKCPRPTDMLTEDIRFEDVDEYTMFVDVSSLPLRKLKGGQGPLKL